jgi:hypothetical protein
MPGEELIGATFTTPKELRHLAEEAYGELFVPTDVVAEAAGYALFAIRVAGGRLIVRAERPGRGYPYVVTRLDAEQDGRRIA